MNDFTSNFRGRKNKKSNDVLRKLAKDTAVVEIFIDEELKAFIPPLKEDETFQLEQNILDEGVRDPLVVWEVDGKNILIDGHNRYSIIQKHDLVDYKLERRTFTNKDAVKDWMIKLQLGRRNLTKEQGSYLRGLQYNREKKSASDNLKQGNSPSSQNVHTGKRTVDIIAEQHKVSSKTIQRDADYARGIELIGESKQVLKQEILSGVSKMKKSDIQAVGSGKKNVKELFEVQNPPPLSPSEGGQDVSNDKLNYHKDKIAYHTKKLMNIGLDKKEIEGVLRDVMKGL